MKNSGELHINLRLPGLNEYIAAERSNRYRAASMKAKWQSVAMAAAKEQLGGWIPKPPVYIRFTWIEPNRRRDKDNISSFGRKVILDALVAAGYLQNDGWKDIDGFSDTFIVDDKNQGVNVEILNSDI